MEGIMNKTQTIAGHSISLEAGRRYIASRPMAERGRTVFPVTVYEMTGQDWWHNGPRLAVIDNLTYDQANAFLAEFNNGLTSFTGRVW